MAGALLTVRPLAVLLVMCVGVLDVATGTYLLLSPEPWRAHGPDTLWSAMATPVGAPAMALFRRMGAFSLHAGVVTVVWAWLARRDRRWFTALLITYTLTGLAFFFTDRAWFAGTPYAAFKQGVSAAWVLALAVHFWPRRDVASVEAS